MKFSSDKAILTGVGLVLLIFIMMVLFSFYQTRHANEAARMVLHTHEVLQHTSSLLSRITSNEASARGYVITGNDMFLSQLKRSVIDTRNSVDSLNRLVKDNPGQLSRLHLLQELIDKRIEFSDSSVNVRKAKGLAEASKMVSLGTGVAYSDNIRSTLKEMENEETRLLAERKMANETANTFLNRLLGVVLILTLLLVIFLFQNARTDLSERKRLQTELKVLNDNLEEQVKKKSAELNNIFERISDAFMAFDRDGNVTYTNAKAAQMTGRKPEDLVGKNLWKEFPLSAQSEFYNNFQQALATGQEMHYEIFAPTIEVWTESFLYPSHDGISLFFRDITEKRKADEALINSEQKYKLLFENNPMPMWMLALTNFEMIDVNEAALHHYGYGKEEFLKLDPREMQPQEDAEKFAIDYKTMIAGISNRGTWRHLKKDGSLILVEIFSYDFTNNGQPVRLLLMNDITEKIKAENKLNESYEEVRRLASHLQDVREEERAGIAREIHDELGQQLTGLKMDVSWLSKKIPAQEDNLHGKIKEIVDLLDVAVKTVRKISSELRPSILDDLGIVEAMTWYSQEFSKRSGIPVSFHSTVERIDVPDNISIALFRIYQESLTNIARHANAKEIASSLRQKDNDWLLTIADNGQGFDMETAANKKTLGLLGMKERALMMGGTYEIKSKPGEGTTVWVSVPLGNG